MTSQIEKELDSNYANFFADWTSQATANWNKLAKDPAYQSSYRRLCALHSLIDALVVPKYDAGSVSFFLEAHNDALVSHVNASKGAWRSALHALRSCIENVCCAIYYRDHPIELELWNAGKFRIGFSDLLKYLERHPLLSKIGRDLTGISLLKAEYAILSKAVHASAANFRMTDKAQSILLWSTEKGRIGTWATQEKKVLEGICLLMAALHQTELQGTKLSPLRTMLYFVISSTKRKELKTKLHISIPSP